MKQKIQMGFSLVGLLAVIVLLGIFLVIAAPNISPTPVIETINTAKEDVFATSAKMMKLNAVTFVNTALPVSLPILDNEAIVISSTALGMENLTTDAFDNLYVEKYVLVVCDDGDDNNANETDCEAGYNYYVTLHSGLDNQGFFNVLVSNLASDTLAIGTSVNIEAVGYHDGTVTLDVEGDGVMDAGDINITAVCTSTTICDAP